MATKFGFLVPGGVERHSFPVAYEFGELAVNAEPRYVRGYAEASLRRLGTDVIDLYYPHYPDPVVPIEGTVGAIGELVDAGLVRHIGLSNVTADHLAAARRLGVGSVAWGPLGTGFLAGTVSSVADNDFRADIPGFADRHLAEDHDRFARSRPPRASHRGSSPSDGCSTRMNMSCPFPAAAPWHTSPRTSPQRRRG